LNNNYLFTSESVSNGHPDKVADQISDKVLDAHLLLDSNAKVALETLVTTNRVILCGEINSSSENIPDYESLIRKTIKDIGYTDESSGFGYGTCNIELLLKEQAIEINKAVDKANGVIGAGDQGMMFGYATNETPELMPLAIDLSHKIMKTYAEVRNECDSIMFMPDGKVQVTIEYEDNIPAHINTILLSLSHKQFENTERLNKSLNQAVKENIMPKALSKYPQSIKKLYDNKTTLIINPSGSFTHYGPSADTGLTGRKIIVDTYGGAIPHGGGAFSGKDPSKVDRSAAYMARYAAKNLVAAKVADKIMIQVSYGIGLSKPVSYYVNSFGTNKTNKKGKMIEDRDICNSLDTLFGFEPSVIINNLQLKNPIYSETACYGHFGRESSEKVINKGNSKHNIEIFTWEKINKISGIQEHFNL
jgi:S-adenosylmethionine synthetase